MVANGEVGGVGQAGALMLPVYLARWGVVGCPYVRALGLV